MIGSFGYAPIRIDVFHRLLKRMKRSQPPISFSAPITAPIQRKLEGEAALPVGRAGAPSALLDVLELILSLSNVRISERFIRNIEQTKIAETKGQGSLSRPARTVRVLEMIGSADRPPSHAELSRELGIAKSTLSALLSELGKIGCIETVPRGYVPGPRLLALCHRLAPRAAFRDALRDTLHADLEALADTTGETVVLLVEIGGDDRQPRYTLPIDHVQSSNPLRFVAVAGPQPVYRTAAGRVSLAFGHGFRISDPQRVVGQGH